ncbi:DPY30 domain-containing protein 1 [Falco cherrug]|uniref:DPY30 domain-containing protein 1 n=2 Tax=Falco TaxID=8952 RepID=UPI00247A425C|nr:DPY30 domain-containing protein 1 [Falco cherrug]
MLEPDLWETTAVIKNVTCNRNAPNDLIFKLTGEELCVAAGPTPVRAVTDPRPRPPPNRVPPNSDVEVAARSRAALLSNPPRSGAAAAGGEPAQRCPRMLERTELEQEREAALVEVEILRKMKEEELMIQRKLEEQCQGQLEQEREELELQNEDDKMLFQQEDQEEIGKTIAELTDKAGVPNLTRIEENEQLESITDLMAEAEQESSQLI